MSFFNREEKTREELQQEIKDECYAMAFGADIPEMLIEYDDALAGPDELVEDTAQRLGIPLYK